MNIGEASAASGVSPKMVRYYETVGLLPPPPRRRNRYRDYGEREVHELRFIGRARLLGFPMKDIRALLSLWRDRDRPSREVREIAAGHLAGLEGRLADIRAMTVALRHLIAACQGDERPDCPILDELAGASSPAEAGPRDAPARGEPRKVT